MYGNYKVYPITPVPKPRMTRGDKHQRKPRGTKYRAFVQECRYRRLHLPASGAHVIFSMPMPKSFSKKKKDELRGALHTQTPDVDNLLKAVMDAVNKDDSHIADVRATKIWGDEGQIAIGIEEPVFASCASAIGDGAHV